MAKDRIHKWVYGAKPSLNPAHVLVACRKWVYAERAHRQWRYVTCRWCLAKRDRWRR